METEATLYEILGVSETATAEDIKSAFRRRAKQTHPDYGGSPTEFRAVQAAYEALADPGRRRKYDAELAANRTTETPPERDVKPTPSRPNTPRTPATPPRQRPRRKTPADGAFDLVGAISWLAAYASGFFAGLGIIGGVAEGQSPSVIWGQSVFGGPTVESLIVYGLGLAGLSYLANRRAGNHSSVVNEETAFGSLLYVVGGWGIWIAVIAAFSGFSPGVWIRALAASAMFGLAGYLVDTAQFTLRREWRAATDYYSRPAASGRLEIEGRRTGPNATRIIRHFFRRWARQGGSKG